MVKNYYYLKIRNPLYKTLREQSKIVVFSSLSSLKDYMKSRNAEWKAIEIPNPKSRKSPIFRKKIHFV